MAYALRTIEFDGATCRVMRVQDLRERQQVENHMLQLAQLDALTEVPNRRAFMQRLQARLAPGHAGEGMALLFLDLNRFKEINDTHGHAVGDAVLRGSARRIAETLRAGDLVGRYGGDEFLILLAGFQDTLVVSDICERLLSAMAEPLQIGELRLSVTAAIGVALFPRDGATVDELLHHADRAMYRAKAESRSRVSQF